MHKSSHRRVQLRHVLIAVTVILVLSLRGAYHTQTVQGTVITVCYRIANREADGAGRKNSNGFSHRVVGLNVWIMLHSMCTFGQWSLLCHLSLEDCTVACEAGAEILLGKWSHRHLPGMFAVNYITNGPAELLLSSSSGQETYMTGSIRQ